MEKRPMYGESYFYISDDGNVVSRRNTLQDIDILNGMKRNYYSTEAKARLNLHMRRAGRKDNQSE